MLALRIVKEKQRILNNEVITIQIGSLGCVVMDCNNNMPSSLLSQWGRGFSSFHTHHFFFDLCLYVLFSLQSDNNSGGAGVVSGFCFYKR